MLFRSAGEIQRASEKCALRGRGLIQQAGKERHAARLQGGVFGVFQRQIAKQARHRRHGLIVFQFNALQSYCQRAGVAREALGLAAKEVALELVEQHKQRQPPFGPRGPAVKPPGQRRCDGGRETGANPLVKFV